MTGVLIGARELTQTVDEGRPPVILDCRARLGDSRAGERLWREGHVPGSQHLDLDRDLAAAAGEGGRHPLPSHEAFTAVIRRLGVTPERPVVVYDDRGGQLAAARAWWMLACWAGHPEVRVLDGGLEAWRTEGGALDTAAPGPVEASDWRPRFDDAARVEAEALLASPALRLDARSRERFRGEVEPIDPVAGHIPGAACRPCGLNLDEEGRFKSAEALDAELPEAHDAIAYCGSGITACHNILAYAIAGRSLPRLYAGSWSHWIRDPARPIATGDG